MSTYKKRKLIENSDDLFDLINTYLENGKDSQQITNELKLENLDEDIYNSLLLKSFKERRVVTFDFLLTLPGHDGTNVLLNVIPFLQTNADYALKLVEYGVNIHHRDFRIKNYTFLHHAILLANHQLAEILIEKNADVNAQNIDGETPLHTFIMIYRDRCLRNPRNSSVVMDILNILLLNGADPSIRNKQGHTAADLLITNYKFCEQGAEVDRDNLYSVMETLYYYTYDNVVPSSTVLNMIALRLPLLDQVFDQIQEITIDYNNNDSGTWSIFSIDKQYLKKLLDRFDHVVLEELSVSEFQLHQNLSIENFNLLLHSHLAGDVIESIRGFTVTELIELYYNVMYQKEAISERIVLELIHFFLTYGLEIDEEDLETVYNNFGRCELFDLLLYMDIKEVKTRKKDIWLCLLYNFQNTDHIDTFLEHPDEGKYSWKNVAQLLHYYADPRLKKFFLTFRYNNSVIMDQVAKLPQIPLLQELARNKFRDFFIDKFQITTSKQFYTLLKCLPISTTHEKIITLERKLYNHC